MGTTMFSSQGVGSSTVAGQEELADVQAAVHAGTAEGSAGHEAQGEPMQEALGEALLGRNNAHEALQEALQEAQGEAHAAAQAHASQQQFASLERQAATASVPTVQHQQSSATTRIVVVNLVYKAGRWIMSLSRCSPDMDDVTVFVTELYLATDRVIISQATADRVIIGQATADTG
ncbi:hypothetical protein SOVF_193130, partial [Spinacia oleracea]